MCVFCMLNRLNFSISLLWSVIRWFMNGHVIFSWQVKFLYVAFSFACSFLVSVLFLMYSSFSSLILCIFNCHDNKITIKSHASDWSMSFFSCIHVMWFLNAYALISSENIVFLNIRWNKRAGKRMGKTEKEKERERERKKERERGKEKKSIM